VKRFLIFAGYAYYPSGGWSDFYSSVDTLVEAKSEVDKYVDRYSWAHVIDRKIWKKVYEK
jgi:hypothetical protein